MSDHTNPNHTNPNHPFPNHDDHMLDLSIDKALSQTPSDHDSDPLVQEFEYAAALVDEALAHQASELHSNDLPHDLAQRLKANIPNLPPQQSSSQSPLQSPPQPTPQSSYELKPQHSSTNSSPTKWVPWMIAAASIAITTLTLINQPQSQPQPITRPAPTVAQLRQQLIDETQSTDLIQWSWTSTDDPAVESEVTGDLVWSDSLNQGYMRIKGIAPNDPSITQYQLWIFDASNPTGDLPQFGEGLLSQRPIDGGVFNIPTQDEVIIPIDAKLNIEQAAAFAVTVEPPGGVVVSDRSRVPLLALAN